MDFQQLKAQGLYPVEHDQGSPRVTLPDHMRDCPTHRAAWNNWRTHYYTWRNPSEWPGGSHIMDSRTTHEERAYTWAVKNLEQMDMIAAFCRDKRGCTPQPPEKGTR